jgi:membrane protease YdiL (CAAX protease family)
MIFYLEFCTGTGKRASDFAATLPIPRRMGRIGQRLPPPRFLFGHFGCTLFEMPVDTLGNPEPLAAEPVVEIAPGNPRMRWFELSLVILVAFGQYILASVFMLNGKQYPNEGNLFASQMIALVNEAACLMLLGYVLWRRKLRFRDIGLRWSNRDFNQGLVVLFLSYLAYYVGYLMIQAIAHTVSPASTAGQTFHWGHFGFYSLPFILLNPFFEELIVRAYLMTEIRALTGSSTLAVIVSVAVQTSYHLYYGWKGALSLAFQFLVFSLYYAHARRITPVILAHEVFDLMILFR